MIIFEDDYFIIQDEESCAFLFRKEDVEKHIKIENIESAIIDSANKIVVKDNNNQTVFYFTISSLSSKNECNKVVFKSS